MMQMKDPLGAAPPRGSFILVSIQETVCVISTFIICDICDSGKSQAERENVTLDASSPKQLFGIVHINAQY